MAPEVSTPPSVAPASLAATERPLAEREYLQVRRGVLATMVLSCALALSLNLADPDLWGHVRYGQDWIAEGALPRTASHTFTAVDYPWINHENLAELAFARCFEFFGVVGLLTAKCLLGMAIVLLMVRVALRRNVGVIATWAVMLLVTNNLTAFFPVRPQLFSFALFAILLWLLERAFEDWHRNQQVRFAWLAPVPLLFAVWVNSHGAFLAGLCVLAVYVGGRVVEAGWWQGKQASRLAGVLTLVTVASFAATLVNPYGVEMLWWLRDSLGRPRPEITEWAAPKASDPVFVPFVMLLLVAIGALAGTKLRRDWTQILILVLVAWQAVSHLRHIAFFALLCGFWLPAHIESAVLRLRSSNAESMPAIRLSPRMRRMTLAALLFAIGLESTALARRLTQLPVYRNYYPVDAMKFMSEHELSGKLVVSFNWAQYAIASLAPDVQVGFDGRFRTCYPQEVVDMHFDFILGEYGGKRHRSTRSGEIDGRRVLEFGSPDLVLVDREYEHSVSVMEEVTTSGASPWVLLYQDAVAQLWGRRSRFDDPASSHYLSPSSRQISDVRHDDSVPWPALPRQRHEPHVSADKL